LPNVEVLPQSRIEASGTRHLIYFDSAQSLVSHTDNTGRVELPYFQPGDTAGVLLRTPNGDWQPHDVKVPPAGQTATIRASL
jgi:YD repeat-containing protein